MTLKTDTRAGQLIFLGDHYSRIVEAIGPNVIKYLDDFVSVPVDDTTGDPTAWTTTVVEAGAGGNTTVTSGDSAGGSLLITTDNAENDGANIQLNGGSFSLASGVTHFYFGTRLKINDVDQTDLFAGLAVTDTAILGGVTDRIGFQSVDGEAALDFVVEKDSTETKDDDLGTLLDSTWHTLEFYYDAGSSTLKAFVDGTESAISSLANLPDDVALRLSYHFLTGEATANTCEIDWVRVVQLGGRAS